MPRPNGKVAWQRDVVSHESCDEKCDVNQADPICAGEIIAQALIVESPDGTFRGYLDEVNHKLELTDAFPTLDKCVECFAEWLGGQGWWVGPKPIDPQGPMTVQQFANMLEDLLTQDEKGGTHPCCQLLWAELQRRGWDIEQTLKGELI